MGKLSELAQMLHYDLHWLSRTIKRLTGKTYTELVQAKRMRQAAYLLQTSRLSVGDIALAVGYENISYFHRLFQKTYPDVAAQIPNQTEGRENMNQAKILAENIRNKEQIRENLSLLRQALRGKDRGEEKEEELRACLRPENLLLWERCLSAEDPKARKNAALLLGDLAECSEKWCRSFGGGRAGRGNLQWERPPGGPGRLSEPCGRPTGERRPYLCGRLT